MNVEGQGDATSRTANFGSAAGVVFLVSCGARCIPYSIVEPLLRATLVKRSDYFL